VLVRKLDRLGFGIEDHAATMPVGFHPVISTSNISAEAASQNTAGTGCRGSFEFV
jgi:hypothetical protein